MRTFVMAALISLACGGAAQADFAAQIEGPDVFGETSAILSGSTSHGGFIRAECSSAGDAILALLIADTSDLPSAFDATLLIMNDTGDRAELPAILTNWNDNYLAIAVEDPGLVQQGIDVVGGAGSQVSLGFTVNILGSEYRDSMTAQAFGSTRAAEQFRDACFN